MTWQGWRISTSLMVAAAALLVVIALAIIAWSLLRFVLYSPQRVADFVEERRQLRGWRAVSRGLIAVGTGNMSLAKRSAGEARKLLAAEPLTLLLSAQAAQLAGNSKVAEAEFRNMLAHEETKLLGLHGLFVEAARRADPVSALAYAEEAAKADPALGWAGDAVIEFRCRAGDWSGALELLEAQIAAKAVSKAAGKRRRAVLMTAQSLTLEEADPAPCSGTRNRRGAPCARSRSGRCARGSIGGTCGKCPARVAHDRQGICGEPASRIGGGVHGIASWRHGARAPRSCKGARAEGAGASGVLARARTRRDGRTRFFPGAGCACAPSCGADPARLSAHGRDRGDRTRRPRQGARVDGACRARAARSGLGRGRLRVGTLAADLAALRQT